MPYVDGFVAAVPAANKDIYRKHAADAAPLFLEFGAARMVETWGDTVPDGQLTDLRRAVKAEADEAVVFSWFEYPDKATRDAANARMMEDPRMAAMGEAMPFDGKRMIYGGFDRILERGAGGAMGYVDAVVVPVRHDAKAAYLDMATMTADIFTGYGATRVVEGWGDDVPDGKITDFRRAVLAEGDETVVFSWVEWPSKAVREEGWKAFMADPRMQPGAFTPPYDGRRMIFGGFAPLLDIR